MTDLPDKMKRRLLKAGVKILIIHLVRAELSHSRNPNHVTIHGFVKKVGFGVSLKYVKDTVKEILSQESLIVKLAEQERKQGAGEVDAGETKQNESEGQAGTSTLTTRSISRVSNVEVVGRGFLNLPENFDSKPAATNRNHENDQNQNNQSDHEDDKDQDDDEERTLILRPVFYPGLSGRAKAVICPYSRDLDFHLNCMLGFDLKPHHGNNAHGRDIASIPRHLRPYLPHTMFFTKRGELLNFSNYRVDKHDGKRGLRDINDDLIHKEVLVHLETAFGIDRQAGGMRFPELPDTLDREAVMQFFQQHPTLQVESREATQVNLVHELNGHSPNDGSEEQEEMSLLIFGFEDLDREDQIAVVYHRPSGVLFPTIAAHYTRLGQKHYKDINTKNKEQGALRRITNLVRHNNEGNINFNMNPAPKARGIYRVTRRTN